MQGSFAGKSEDYLRAKLGIFWGPGSIASVYLSLNRRSSSLLLNSVCCNLINELNNAEFSSENIVESIGKVLNVSITEIDISVAHPLASYKKDTLPKFIVKFTRKDVCN